MIEGIVRPFQSPVVTQNGQIPAPSIGPVTPASLRWGAVGKLPSTVASFKIEAPCDTYSEVSRETEPVRITNPNDSSQYVDVARTKSLTMNHNKNPDSVLYSPFTADITGAFMEFSADVQSAFNDFNISGPTTGKSGCHTKFTFNPPA